MSDLIITPVEIQNIKPHPNADRLEIAVVGGWEVIVGRGNHNVGDIMVHVPPDVMVPKNWADAWDVTKYLSWKKNANKGRVKAAKLRDVVSFGFLVPNDSNSVLGTDLAEYYGIEKYDPPQTLDSGQRRNRHPLFHNYTNIQNLRNFSDKLNYNVPIVLTEKIHGTNSRVGWVKRLNNTPSDIDKKNNFEAWRDAEYELVIGTHRTQRDPENCGIYGLPWKLHQEALEAIFDWAEIQARTDGGLQSLIIFGEIFGAGVQDLHYGAKQEKDYRAFDIAINGQYMNWRAMEHICRLVKIPTAPVITSGIFTFGEIIQEAQGITTLDDIHTREGIVARPMYEELFWGKGSKDPNPKRMIFKIISDDYLLRKGGTEMH